MKKLLALVMALVMTLGLATVAANAAYPDAADVELKEAVEVMSAVGVFQGDENGNFKPQANLDRAAAAKLIAYLDLGEKTAEALPAVKAFDDVPASHWAAKYIAYCANAGYIAGAGDGKFYPSNALTGYAFGKMILCVLGYDAAIEGFTGSSWSINVAKLMQSNDIAEGIDSPASATLTREQAAQYCLNALKADMVEYSSKGTTIEINGAKIATGASSASKVANTVAKDYRTVAADQDTVMQLAEKLYEGDLKLDADSSDELGRPADKWTYKDDEVGAYGETAKLVYTAEVSTSDLYKTLKNYYIKDAVTYDESAAAYTAGTALFAAQTKAAVTQAQSDAIQAFTGNGKTVEIFADSSKIITKVAVIAPVYAKITNVTTTKANSSHGAYSTYSFDSKSAKVFSTVVDKDADKDQATLNGTFAKNDYCTYYATDDGYVLDPVTSVSGVLTSINNKGVMTIDGTSYKLSAATNAVAPSVDKASQDFYVDSFGYIIEAYTDSTANYAYVVSVANKNVLQDDGSLEAKDYAVLVFSDGTVKEVRIKTAVAAKALYTYKVSDKDVYTLTAVAAARTATSTSLADDAKSVGALYTNAKTVYYVLKYAKDDEDVMKFQKTVTAYTGYTNAPAYAADASNTIAALDSSSTADDIADVVFIDTTKDAADTGKYVYVKGSYVTTSSGVEFDTIVEGEDSSTTKDNATDLAKDTLYEEVNTPTVATAAGTTIQNKGGLLYLDGANSGKTIADDVPVYTINIDDDSVSVGTAADLSTKFEADPQTKGGTRGVYVEYNSAGTKAQTVYILYNSED